MEVNSRPRVRVTISSLIFSLLLISLIPISTQSPLYAPYCNSLVPESPPSTVASVNSPNLRLFSAFFSGGAPILSPTNSSARSSSLLIQSLSTTKTPTTTYVTAVLNFWGLDGNSTGRGLRQISYRRPRFQRRRNAAVFQLRGFYSESSRSLCMVDTSYSNSQSFGVVLKLNYPNITALDSSIVTGTLVGTDTNQFEPISILGFSMMDDYMYTYVDEEVNKGAFRVYDDTENVGLNSNHGGICMRFTAVGRFELEYNENCENVGCNPLGEKDKNLPSFMSLNEIKCERDKARVLIDFSDLNFNGRRLPFHPNTTLVAEGAWSPNSHLDLVACRLLNLNDSLTKASIGDCSIRLSLRFPMNFSLRNRSSVVGLMWSSKKVDDQGYFGKISFKSPSNGNTRVKGHKYVYTVVNKATDFCSKKAIKHKKGQYPNEFSSDMRFDMIVRDSKGKSAFGYSSPLSVGDLFFQHRPMFALTDESQVQSNITTTKTGNIVNISYIMTFGAPPGFKLGGDESSANFVEISAEGIYNQSTGTLCMIGCRHIRSSDKKVPKNGTFDCELAISLQYSLLDSKVGGDVKGTIISNRPKSDPLYFDKLEVSSSSIFSRQAKDSIWTMDFEITLVLVSNTLLCIFIILQLFYVKKHPDVLPSISLVMLTVLTLALLIPLVLNFEALFMAKNNRQYLLNSGGGWVELNEVLVRIITMIAFLLEFRLLQLAWSSRQEDESSSAVWASDKKVVYITIPLYVFGALAAWLLHHYKHSHKASVIHPRAFIYNQNQSFWGDSFWGDFKSYAGLILDGFLLPQIIFNVCCDTKEKALAPLFYIGTTVVRLLPHGYDLYRAHASSWYSGGIYADRGMDYYSTMWDIAISIGGLVFIGLVYLQQRFGGRCFLPKRFSERVEYEKVPVSSTELATR